MSSYAFIVAISPAPDLLASMQRIVFATQVRLNIWYHWSLARK